MALKNRVATGKYVRIKDGKFYLSTDKTFSSPSDELEGQLVDIYFKDEEYEGTPQKKLYLTFQDGEDNYILGLNFESLYASTFLNFINNVDVKKVLSLHPISDEVKDAKGVTKTKNSLLISQNGKFAKSYFTKDNPNGLPQMKKIKVSGKEVWDKTDMMEFLENLVDTKIKPNLVKKSTTIINEVADEDPFPATDEDDFPWSK